MAHRFLLTLLALLTGLCAQVAPGEARAAPQRASAVLVAASATESGEARSAEAGIATPDEGPARGERLPPDRDGPAAAAVLIGIDRARE